MAFRLYTPSKIGVLLGMTGAEVNALLAEKGFQTKNELVEYDPAGRLVKASWLLTEKGRAFGTMRSGVRAGTIPYRSILWFDTILPEFDVLRPPTAERFESLRKRVEKLEAALGLKHDPAD